ncbi:hypothetical protein [Flavobacterium cerinum]|uniref:Uncharacterized protein n=1 Tax=Flavobacterium cerinum TaxID=2502784 RepID=A0ABY5IUM8_9FLAO|nr:hypothetical protein [Flavobacterium cerinum]UUC46527.1 hypothetical protein NOX80_04835 [Flavobacterium cerinum]
MSENSHIMIPKKVETEDQLDFHFLRRTGVKYIEELGGKLWTDYNSHDPGITTLEVLSYAITDLGMRMNLNMEDILSSKDKEKNIENQFIKATEILPSRPLNELDYRKLFIDIGLKGGSTRAVKNCWWVPKTELIYADCKTSRLALNPSDLGPDAAIESFNVKGLYDLYVEYGEGLEGEDSSDVCDRSNTRIKILERYHANRSLCEDLVDIKEIETQSVAVCARIEVTNKADEELVHAKVLRSINNYLSPEVHFYSLKQMLDKGYTTDEIFDGPLLDNGFIDTEELRNSQLRKEVRLSDIINVVMKVEGVKEIREISIAGCNGSLQQGDEWLICIEHGKKPVLCDLSSFSYSKGSLPLNINKKKVAEYLDTFLEEQEALRVDARLNKVLELPEGTPYDLGNYESILNEFPDTFGVGTSGIIGNPNVERQALAKQLQAYLLFFDKILASYFKHLEKVKEVLSVNGTLKRTYFTQALKGINGFESLVNDYVTNDDDKLTDSLYEELDNSVERRNQVLDHLIARFAETFSDYTFLMKALYGQSTDEIVLRNKEVFLKEYSTISTDRGLGHNYNLTADDDIWDTFNVSGAQKRIARLLGIENYKHRNVSDSPVLITKTPIGNNKFTYKWKVKDKDNAIALCGVKIFQIEYAAIKTLNEAIYQTIQIDQEDLENALEATLNGTERIGNMMIKKSGMDNFYVEIVDDSDDSVVIATHKKTNPYTSQQALKDGILKLVDYLKYHFTEEGIFLVEHLLLKPSVKNYDLMGGIGCMAIEDTFIVMYDGDGGTGAADPDTFMTTCEEGCESDIFDPYSYRVSVVLSGYAYRFMDADFRRYAETVIRQELPAHVLAKICWVGDRQSEVETAMTDLSDFERTYKKFLLDKARNNISSLGQSTKDLLTSLTNLNNIYKPGRLLDCAVDDNDSLDGKIILGQSNI